MTVGICFVSHVYIICFVRAVNQLAVVSLDGTVVSGIVDRDIQLVLVVVLQVVGHIQPLLHHFPV